MYFNIHAALMGHVLEQYSTQVILFPPLSGRFPTLHGFTSQKDEETNEDIDPDDPNFVSKHISFMSIAVMSEGVNFAMK